MKELNYPVKYAVLEVKENGEYLDNIEEEVKGFINSVSNGKNQKPIGIIKQLINISCMRFDI